LEAAAELCEGKEPQPAVTPARHSKSAKTIKFRAQILWLRLCFISKCEPACIEITSERSWGTSFESTTSNVKKGSLADEITQGHGPTEHSSTYQRTMHFRS
jgi:hypothetical protein